MESVEILIIGGGPAGMAAAIQLKRMGYEALVFERNRLGGMLANANLAGANLAGANLRGAILDNANLAGANLEGADFADASMDQTIWSDGKVCADTSYGSCD